jgi:integrase
MTQDGWLFANPATDRPFHQEEIQKKHIRRAAKAAEITPGVGWKTFRHSFRSWLDQTDAPIGVMTDGKRQAHGNVVEMILKPANNPTTVVAEAAPVAIVV